MVFLVSDCLAYCGEQIIMKTFSQRYDIISKIIDEDYVTDSYLEPYTLIKKEKFRYGDMIDVKERYIPKLPFRINGYLFKTEDTASYDILYIFPECRNKLEDKKEEVTSPPQTPQPKELSEDKNEAVFLMKTTEFPDVYEIYMFDNTKGKRARVGYAGVPNIQCSVMIKSWFENNTSGELYVKCKKNPVNDKWIPYSLDEKRRN